MIHLAEPTCCLYLVMEVGPDAEPDSVLPQFLSTVSHLFCCYVWTQVFVNDQFLNWDVENRIKVRIISARAYHSLFMHNM